MAIYGTAEFRRLRTSASPPNVLDRVKNGPAVWEAVALTKLTDRSGGD
jgi:hypothetical protein